FFDAGVDVELAVGRGEDKRPLVAALGDKRLAGLEDTLRPGANEMVDVAPDGGVLGVRAREVRHRIAIDGLRYIFVIEPHRRTVGIDDPVRKVWRKIRLGGSALEAGALGGE